jgi:hypothetical protein
LEKKKKKKKKEKEKEKPSINHSFKTWPDPAG